MSYQLFKVMIHNDVVVLKVVPCPLELDCSAGFWQLDTCLWYDPGPLMSHFKISNLPFGVGNIRVKAKHPIATYLPELKQQLYKYPRAVDRKRRLGFTIRDRYFGLTL